MNTRRGVMKIILSRKGFDSASGKVASPIFPSEEMYTLPIPETFEPRKMKRYQEIRVGDHQLGILVQDLTKGKVRPEMFVHLDPDLDAGSVKRPANWRPIFGQVGAAERHLQNQGVKEGDVFVFYGWFRQVERAAGEYRYVSTAPDLHVIFGWLQIEQRFSVDSRSKVPDWAYDHPHYKAIKDRRFDSIYISTSCLHLPWIEIHQSGAGRFHQFSPELCLTAPHQSRRSVWQLPKWFYPREPSSSLSYHRDLSRWERSGNTVLLRSVGRGQEFVLDCLQYPEAVPWLCQLLCLHDTAE